MNPNDARSRLNLTIFLFLWFLLPHAIAGGFKSCLTLNSIVAMIDFIDIADIYSTSLGVLQYRRSNFRTISVCHKCPLVEYTEPMNITIKFLLFLLGYIIIHCGILVFSARESIQQPIRFIGCNGIYPNHCINLWWTSG